MSSTYMEKLKDPRWQKKRLEILNRDEWTCRVCKSEQKTLHVHHTFYKNGRNPWAYPSDTLVTLCEGCHEKERAAREGAERCLLAGLRLRGFLAIDLSKIFTALEHKKPYSILRIFKERLRGKNNDA